MRSMGFMVVVVMLIVGVGAGLAAAGGPDKAGRVLFVKRADDICQHKNNDAKRRIQRGVRYLEHHRLRAGGIKFEAAWRELRLGYRRIARLPRPGKDHTRIAKWLRRERYATATGVDAAVALQHHRLDEAARLTRKAAHRERLAYRPVKRLKFHHCAPL
jgi:hypothetical protein